MPLSFVVACVLVLRCCDCVCYNVSFGSKVRPGTFGCIAMGVVYFEVQIVLIFCRVVNRVQVILYGFSVSLFCPDKNFM